MALHNEKNTNQGVCLGTIVIDVLRTVCRIIAATRILLQVDYWGPTHPNQTKVSSANSFLFVPSCPPN